MEGDPNETSIKALFQGMVPTAAELLQGSVIQDSPLKIQIDNDSKLVIGQNITVVPKHLTDYSVGADISLSKGSLDSTTAGGDRLKTFTLTGGVITVHARLVKGDRVHVLAIQNGKKYFVLGRV